MRSQDISATIPTPSVPHCAKQYAYMDFDGTLNNFYAGLLNGH